MVHVEDYLRVKKSLIDAEKFNISIVSDSLRVPFLTAKCNSCSFLDARNGKCLNKVKQDFSNTEYCNEYIVSKNYS